MKLKNHIVLSIVISGFLFSITKSLSISIASFISGVFIDCDHILDYWREYGLNFDMNQFFKSYKTCRFRKLFLIFHGWEWIFIWGIISYFNGWDKWMLGVVIGISHHMIADQIANSSKVFGYFLLWRMYTSFERDRSFSIKN